VAAWELTLLVLALLTQLLKISKQLSLHCHQVHLLYAAFCWMVVLTPHLQLHVTC